MTIPDGLLDRVQEFLDQIEKDKDRNISLDAYSVADPAGNPVAKLMWGDVQMLVAIVRGATTDLDSNATPMKEFLQSAERGVAGWKRANTNQIEIIGRLQAQIEQKDRDIRDAEEWQNEVADLIPEDAEGINPEGAQEGIILDYMKYLQTQEKAYKLLRERLQLALYPRAEWVPAIDKVQAAQDALSAHG